MRLSRAAAGGPRKRSNVPPTAPAAKSSGLGVTSLDLAVVVVAVGHGSLVPNKGRADNGSWLSPLQRAAQPLRPRAFRALTTMSSSSPAAARSSGGGWRNAEVGSPSASGARLGQSSRGPRHTPHQTHARAIARLPSDASSASPRTPAAQRDNKRVLRPSPNHPGSSEHAARGPPAILASASMTTMRCRARVTNPAILASREGAKVEKLT